jgi:hypothetical protein
MTPAVIDPQAPFEFPPNPNVGDKVTDPNGIVWEWTGVRWARSTTGGGGGTLTQTPWQSDIDGNHHGLDNVRDILTERAVFVGDPNVDYTFMTHDMFAASNEVTFYADYEHVPMNMIELHPKNEMVHLRNYTAVDRGMYVGSIDWDTWLMSSDLLILQNQEIALYGYDPSTGYPQPRWWYRMNDRFELNRGFDFQSDGSFDHAEAMIINRDTGDMTFDGDIDLTSGHSFKISGVSVTAGGGSQSPWVMDINADDHNLDDVRYLSVKRMMGVVGDGSIPDEYMLMGSTGFGSAREMEFFVDYHTAPRKVLELHHGNNTDGVVYMHRFGYIDDGLYLGGGLNGNIEDEDFSDNLTIIGGGTFMIYHFDWQQGHGWEGMWQLYINDVMSLHYWNQDGRNFAPLYADHDDGRVIFSTFGADLNNQEVIELETDISGSQNGVAHIKELAVVHEGIFIGRFDGSLLSTGYWDSSIMTLWNGHIEHLHVDPGTGDINLYWQIRMYNDFVITRDSSMSTTFRIDRTTGDVHITGKLFLNGVEITP